MKLKHISLAILVALSVSTAVQSVELSQPYKGGEWYYNLGGEQTVSQPLSTTTNSITLGGSANWGAGFNCSAFNPTLGISNSLNDIKNGVDAFQGQLINAATSAIASLPLLMLQRANPGLYDMLMSGLASAEETLNISTKSCELAMKEIGKGENPYYDWVTVSRTGTWKDKMGDGTTNSASDDINSAKKEVDETNGDDGLDWLEGDEAGGKGQPPIRIPSDIVKAGYNITLNRGAKRNNAAPLNSGRVGDLWKTPAEAEAFSRSVLGEDEIRTYNKRPTKSTPGRGLAFEIAKETDKVTPLLNDLLSGATPINMASLSEVSTAHVVISYALLVELRKANPTDRAILANKLSQEVATSRVIEKALMLRRMMISGLQEPNIHASGVGAKATEKYTKTLDTAIDSVLYEAEVNKKITSQASVVIMRLGDNLQRVGDQSHIPVTRDTTIPTNGGVIK